MKNMFQQPLLDLEDDFLTIAEAATFFSVSSATIRNWIKTGHLSLVERGKIAKSSILQFKEEQLGKHKLTGRANKSQKDSHNHGQLSEAILNKLASSDLSLIGSEYETQLSNAYRNKEGIYYTPKDIVDDLLVTSEDISNKTFCDPCCGSGNFLIKAIELGFKPENIYGFDVDPVAVEIARKRIEEKTGYQSMKIKCQDFLEVLQEQHCSKYDYIYTNPPWGKKLEKKVKQQYAEKYEAGMSNDTCALFFFACLSVLEKKGRLGLLLPEAFFNVASYETARKKLLSYKIEALKDYGKAFKGLQTGAVAFVLQNEQVNLADKINCLYRNNAFKREISSFINNPKSIINLNCDDDEAKVINYLYSKPYLTLENKAIWGLGIVTGNNKKYLKSKLALGLIPVFKGSDITKNGLKDPSHFISTDFSLYQQVAPLTIFEAKEKLVYKFISSNLCFAYDNEQSYMLNSANMLIVNKEFPISMPILSQLMNSEIMNWLFNKLFNTYKVLRSDLEALPIFTQYIDGNNFSEENYLNLLNIEKYNGTFRIKT